MFFEEEYRKIIEQLKKNEDYAVMRTICEDIIDLLKENGVKVDGVVLRDITSTKTMRVVDNFEVQLNGLDFTEHDKKYIDEIIDLQKRISELESELAVKEEPLPCSCDECEGKIAKINLNDNVKVKLTPYGAEIYYHQFDETNKQARRTVIEPYMPEIDKDGYTQFQLHHFVNLYGEHIRMGNKNVIEPLDIILCD